MFELNSAPCPPFSGRSTVSRDDATRRRAAPARERAKTANPADGDAATAQPPKAARCSATPCVRLVHRYIGVDVLVGRLDDLIDFDTGVPDVPQPLSRIFLEAALDQPANGSRCVGGEGRPVGIPLQNRGDRVRDVSPSTPSSPRASRTARSRTPRCQCACPPSFPALARGSCSRRCRR